MAGFYRIWMPNFGLISKPLYEATKGPDGIPLDWKGETKKSFKHLRQALIQAPALGVHSQSSQTFYSICSQEKRHSSRSLHSETRA